MTAKEKLESLRAGKKVTTSNRKTKTTTKNGWSITTGVQKKTKAPPKPKKESKPKKTVTGGTTVVSLGKNPSARKYAEGKALLKGTAPKAKAPSAPRTLPTPPAKKWKPINVAAEVEKHQRLSPHLPGEKKTTPAYVWKKSENPHLKTKAKTKAETPKIPGIVKTAIAAAAVVATGVAANKAVKLSDPKPAPKAKAPKAPAVKAKTPAPPKPVAKAKTPALPKLTAKVKAPEIALYDPGKAQKAEKQAAKVSKPAAKVSKAPAAPKPDPRFRPPPLPKVEAPAAPKVEAPKPRSIPVGASPKEVKAIEIAASQHAVGNKPAAKAPAAPKAAAAPKTRKPRTPAATPPAEAWDAARRKESLTSAREARKSGNVEAMNTALKNLPPSGKKAAREKVNLEAGIESASGKPKGTVGTAVAKVKTHRKAKGAGKQAQAAERVAKKQAKITADGGAAAEVRASQQAVGQKPAAKTPPLPKVKVTDRPAPPKPKAAPGASDTATKNAAAQIEKAATAVSAEGNKAIYVAARQAQKTGDTAAIREALKTLPKGTKKSAKLTGTLNAALESAGNKPKATPGPAIGNNNVTKVDGIAADEKQAVRELADEQGRERLRQGGTARTGDERRVGNQRNQGTRQTQRGAKAENRARPVGNQRSTRRGKAQRRGTFTVPEMSERDKALKAKAWGPANADIMEAELDEALKKTGRTRSQDKKIRQEKSAQRKDQRKTGVKVKDPKTGEMVWPDDAARRVQAQPLDANPARQADADNKAANERAAKQASETNIADANEGYQKGADTARGGNDRRLSTDLLTADQLADKTTRLPYIPGEEDRTIKPKGRPHSFPPGEADVSQAHKPNSDFELKLELPGGKTVTPKVSTPNAAVAKAVREVATPGEGLRVAEGRGAGLVGRERNMSDAAQDRRLLAFEATGQLKPPTQDLLTMDESAKITTEARGAQNRGEQRRANEDRRSGVDRIQAEIEKSRTGVDLLSTARAEDRSGTERRADPERRAETEVRLPEMPEVRPERAASSGDSARAVEAQADKILKDAGWKPMEDLTETEGEGRKRYQRELLAETQGAAKAAAKAVVPMGENQTKSRADIVKQQLERAARLPATRVGTADLPKARAGVNQGLGYVYREHTAEQAKTAKDANLNRARRRGAVQGAAAEQRASRDRREIDRRTQERRVGKAGPPKPGQPVRDLHGGNDWRKSSEAGDMVTRRGDMSDPRVENRGRPVARTKVPNLATPEMGKMLNAPEGRPGHVPRETRTDRRSSYGKNIDTTTPEGRQKVHERNAARQASQAEKPLSISTPPGVSEAKKPAAKYAGTGAKFVRGGAIATAIFAALGAGEAGASQLHKGWGAATKAAGTKFKSDVPEVAAGIAKFTGMDLAASFVVPKVVTATAARLGASAKTAGITGRAASRVAKLGLAVEIGRHAIPYAVDQSKKLASAVGEWQFDKGEAAREKKGSEKKYGTVAAATRTRKMKEAYKKRQKAQAKKRG